MPQPAPHVICYLRKDCCICEEERPTIDAVTRTFGLGVEYRDITQYPEIEREHGDWVPVVAINDRIRLRAEVNAAWLAREIRAALSAPTQPPPKRLRVGVAIIFDERGRMLIDRRPGKGYFGGWWEWPGGKCLMGESPRRCARRELREEIGVEAQALHLFERRRVLYPGRIIDLHCFVGKLRQASKPHRQAFRHCWKFPQAVKRKTFLQANLPILDRLIAGEAQEFLEQSTRPQA